MAIDPNFIGLSNKLFKKGLKNHLYRGYTVLNDNKLEMRESRVRLFYTFSQSYMVTRAF